MRRIHIMLNVSVLKKAKAFYSNLLGLAPSKEKPDYLQWKIENPSLNLSIKSSKDEPMGVNHFGIETPSDEDLQLLYDSAKNAELQLQEEGYTNCCYALSNKAWAQDADGNEWELFKSYADHLSYYESASKLK